MPQTNHRRRCAGKQREEGEGRGGERRDRDRDRESEREREREWGRGRGREGVFFLFHPDDQLSGLHSEVIRRREPQRFTG